MSLILYSHPLASFCWKVLIALYENETPFEQVVVDLNDDAQREKLTRLWPVAKFPVLHDTSRDRLVPESSIIIDYLAQHHPGPVALCPADPDVARQTRLRDRFYDLYVQEPMQKCVADVLRPADKKDPHGVEQAKATLATAYGMIETDMAKNRWAMGDSFTMADCAAAPALFYSRRAVPLGPEHSHVRAYLERLLERPSVARVVKEAGPYLHLVPLPENPA